MYDGTHLTPAFWRQMMDLYLRIWVLQTEVCLPQCWWDNKGMHLTSNMKAETPLCGTHMVEGKNLLLQVVLWPLYTKSSDVYTHIHRCLKKKLGARETDQWLRASRCCSWRGPIPPSEASWLPLTPALGDPVPLTTVDISIHMHIHTYTHIIFKVNAFFN